MRLKKKAGELSVFEKEIRNPGEHLQEAIKNIKSKKLSLDEAKPIIDNAIEKDIEMNREDVVEYFGIYSDIYKDCYGIRPRYDYTQDYYHSIYDFMVLQNKTSCNYTDYSSLDFENLYEDEDDEYEMYDETNNESDFIDEDEDENEEFDKLPLQQSHHKRANEMRKRLKKTAGKMYEIKCEATVSNNYFIEDAKSKEEAGALALNLFKKDLDATYFKAKDLKVVAWS